MKNFLKPLLSIANIASLSLKIFPIKSFFDYKFFIRKVILYSVSFVLLITAYVFSCLGLYYFLLPYGGETLAAFALCLLFLILSGGLVLTVRLLKSKKKQSSSQPYPFVENNLKHIPSSQEFTQLLMKASPAILVILLGVAAVATYVMLPGKKEK